jgi:protein-S-isoprenylcysteine O-methyltransferase Ste14
MRRDQKTRTFEIPHHYPSAPAGSDTAAQGEIGGVLCRRESASREVKEDCAVSGVPRKLPISFAVLAISIIVVVPAYAYVMLALGWIAWFLPFPINRWNFQKPARQDNRARWGLALQVVAYSLLWQSSFWKRSPGPVALALAAMFFVFAGVWSWTGVQALGRHLRFDAGLSTDHQLVREGAYRWLRHPIYTSMFCLLLGTGFVVTPIALLIAAIIVFVAGTEIRVRIEDGLLASRFGDQFRDYQRHVSAYVPFIH